MKRQQFKVYKKSLENLYVYAHLIRNIFTTIHHQNKTDTSDSATRCIKEYKKSYNFQSNQEKGTNNKNMFFRVYKPVFVLPHVQQLITYNKLISCVLD